MVERLEVQQRVLSSNDRLAAELRESWRRQAVFCMNVVGSAGCGKTSLLERTLQHFQGKLRAAVLVGDVQTERDAQRLARFGFPVRQIITAGVCHLDASMIQRHLPSVHHEGLELLAIENVGNLICPSSYDLGEDVRVVVLSTVEGDDKPLKYPGMFRRSQVLVISKMDLLGLTDFDVERAVAHAKAINPEMTIFKTSSRTGEGLDEWYRWVERQVAQKRLLEDLTGRA
ncbi:MAG: hydrogenase nickel incorporation protein HypB [Bacillota bacterium]